MAKHKFAINNQEFDVDVGARQGSHVQVTVNGKAFDVEVKSASPRNVAPSMGVPTRTVPPPSPAATGSSEVRSPMAGLVLGIKVKTGDQVSVGDELLSLEAMKMENAITAERAGTVKRIVVEANQVVNQGDLLLELA